MDVHQPEQPPLHPPDRDGITGAFAWIEARRYRGYDIWRSRVRTLQENLFANALDPTGGVERDDWRVALGEDYRDPQPRLSMPEALAHRLRRVYLPLLLVLLVAWVVRITAFDPKSWVRTAAVGNVPGIAVVAAVGAYCALVVGIAVWSTSERGHEVRGEITGSETEIGDRLE